MPQFIDVEDKIFGPFTLRQFIYVAGGASAALIAITLFGLFWGLLISSPLVILAAALAFYKINNRPFISVLESAFRYMTRDKLYIWRKTEAPPETQETEEKKYSRLVVPHLSESKLKDMNWELDVKKKEGEELNKLNQ